MDKIKVLYIDDEQSNLNAFKAAFRRIFEVYLANSAEQGYDILNKHPIEVILSDQRMPEKTGVDFFQSILDIHPNPMRILITAYTDVDAIINSINKGRVYRYVTKPWNEFELKLTIENAFHVYSLQEQNNKMSAKYNRIFNESTDPIMLFDDKGRVVDYNKAAIETLNASKKDIHFLNFISFLTNREFGKEILKELEIRDSIVDREIEIVTLKGEHKTLLASLNTIRDFQSNIANYQVIFKDITKLKSAQELMLKTIIETQEFERERISKDLHDGLGQTLAAIKLNLQAIKNKNAVTEEESNRIDRLLNISIDQLRDICFNTSPKVLSEFGLIQGVEELIDRTKTDQLLVNFEYCESLPHLSKSLEVAIYRIIQEFINNSIKHSDASIVQISVSENNGNILLNLSDNGKGFEIKDLMVYKGQGLKNINSRVKSFGGSIEFNGERMKGTSCSISFPRRKE